MDLKVAFLLLMRRRLFAMGRSKYETTPIPYSHFEVWNVQILFDISKLGQFSTGTLTAMCKNVREKGGLAIASML